MNDFFLDYDKINHFSKRDRAYAKLTSKLRDFMPFSPDWEGLERSQALRFPFPVNRSLLYQVISDQYKDRHTNFILKENLESIQQDNCFTITTAHQPILMLGPLYVIYKAISTIKIAEELNRRNTKNQFVPIFVVGGEDHDFEEISRVNIFGKTYRWGYDHRSASVGQIDPKELKAILDKIETLFSNDAQGMELFNLMKTSYLTSHSFTEATQGILHDLLGDYGLIVLDMSDKRLKESFIPIMRKEILSGASQSLVEQAQEELKQLGFKPQAHAREINFFFQSPLGRQRIIRENNGFSINNTDLRFTCEEMEEQITKRPELFSPNVVMRPIYQSYTLPDIAYVGGGGELAYWMERKYQFREFDQHFPVLIRRSSVSLMPKKLWKSFQDLGFNLTDLARPVDELIKEYIAHNEEIDFNPFIDELSTTFNKALDYAKAIDHSLAPKISSLNKKNATELRSIEKKLINSLKEKNAAKIRKIQKAKDAILSDKYLQERK